jgi:hypothetical protein
VCEKKLFYLLKEKSIPMEKLTEAIKHAAEFDPKEDAEKKKALLENVDRLLRFPTSHDPNGDTLKYGYTTLSNYVAKAPYPLTAVAIVLSLATGLTYTRISLKLWKDNYRNLQLLIMTSAFFIIGGLVPYFLFGNKTGNLVMVSFYAGLFTWVFNQHFSEIKKKYGLTGDFARSSEQADAIYRFYMRLLMFAFSCFGIVIIGLMFHVSRMMGEMYVLSPELRQYLFFFMTVHDFYGSMILFVFVVLKLVHILEETVKLYPPNDNNA